MFEKLVQLVKTLLKSLSHLHLNIPPTEKLFIYLFFYDLIPKLSRCSLYNSTTAKLCVECANVSFYSASNWSDYIASNCKVSN